MSNAKESHHSIVQVMVCTLEKFISPADEYMHTIFCLLGHVCNIKRVIFNEFLFLN